ncbi:MAG: protein kinase domain-containing protein [bacterium]
MNTIVDTASLLINWLSNTFSYLLNTAPYNIIIELIAGLLVLYLFSLMLKKIFSSKGGKKPNFSVSARDAIKRGDFASAGDFYAYEGKLAKAYEFYSRAGAKRKASEIALRMNKIDTAINLLIEAGDANAAARLAKSTNNFKKAGDIYKSLKSYTEAAAAYEEAKEYAKAAEMYESAEMFLPAGELYLKTNNVNKAAHCYLKAFTSDYSTEKIEMDRDYVDRMIELAKKTGDLLKQVGMYEKASKVYASMKLYELAADASKMAGRLAEAAEYLLMANKTLESAALFEKVGDTVRANTIRAEYYRGIGEKEKSAQAYESIEDFSNAAELYYSINNYTKAGEMYEKAKEYELSAQMYELAKEPRKAAEMYEKAGDLNKAKQLYKSVGDEKKLIYTLIKEKKFLEAAEQYMKAGEIDNAIRSLQMIEPSNEADYYRACVLLGGIFLKKNMVPQAIEKFKKAIGNKPLDKTTIEAYYGISRAFEISGDVEKAILIYDKILAEDYNYRDVKNRIKSLKEQPQKVQRLHPGSDVRYRMIREIGRGNMGTVYEAYDNILERKVAYKVPNLDLTHHPELVTDFLREAKSAAALNHPNIVIVYDAGKQGNDYYIAMELINGKTLKDILRIKGRLNSDEAIKIAEQLTRALVYAHSNNIIHRDIKPGNIMITDNNIVKLMDFGLAKVLHDASQTATKVIGTPYYMAPEQIKGDRIGFETDIYALGVVMFEMLTGIPPFQKGDVYYHHLHTPPPSPKTIVPEISDKLNSIILRCLQKEPEKRFVNASELLSAIVSVEPRG